MKEEHKRAERLLKTAKGQIEGVLKMMDEERYCIDISNQLLAIEAMIKKANEEIITHHMQMCVKEAFDKNDVDHKIDELMILFRKLNK